MTQKQNFLFLPLASKALVIFLLLEFTLLRTLQRVFTVLIFPGAIFLIASIITSFIVFTALGYRLKLKQTSIVMFLVAGLIAYSTIIGTIGFLPPAILSILYYVLLPITAVMIYLELISSNEEKLVKLALLFAPLTITTYSYIFLSMILASHYRITLPSTNLILTLGVGLSTILPVLLGIVGLRLMGRVKKMWMAMSILLPGIIIVPILAISIAKHKIANYLALYILEVFGIPIQTYLVPIFLISIWIGSSGALITLKHKKYYALGSVLLILSGYQINISYHALIWLTGLSLICTAKLMFPDNQP